MKEYWVDFSGSFKVLANDKESAEKAVMEMLSEIGIEYIEVNGVEEIE